MNFIKKILFLAITVLLVYLAYDRIIKPFLTTDSGKTANFFFGNSSIPPAK